MAAKVVMVAVPTVLGIASIRVYRVSEAPTDGLVKREGLNIYTPLTPPAAVRFVQDSPGLLESGVATAREGVVPAYQAAKAACVSIKKGTINLYHAGQDVFCYLKDPPPEFLPRFGIITMAGLLGMFIARKGSRFNRLAVPVGLMTAGASVCYPAQAVAVCKVTGRKVYAAGQWSGATVASLFASKEPDAKDIVASQVPSPESAGPPETSESRPPSDSSARSAITSEAEAGSAESAPGANEPLGAVTTEEESSVTSSDPGPSETSAEPVKLSEWDLEGSAESTSSSEPQTAEPAPDTTADPALLAPAEPAPAEAAPAETVSVAPVEVAYAESSPVEAAPVKDAPVESAPVIDAPAPVAPLEAAEGEPAPGEPADQPPAEPFTPPPVEEEPTTEESKEGAGFKPDPSLLDFGQSSPEDADLYSTRS